MAFSIVSTGVERWWWGGKKCDRMRTHGTTLFLGTGVIDLAKEVLFLVVIAVLLQPQSQDEPVSDEQDSQQAQVVDSEPFVGALRGQGGRGGQDGGRGTGDGGHDALVHLGDLHGHGEGRSGALGNAKG